MTAKKKLYRLPKEGKIFGVCAGLSEYFSMDVTLMRIIFILLGFATGGAMLFVYLVLAIVMPSAERPAKVDSKGDDVGEKFELLGKDLRDNNGVENLKNYLGFALLVVGSWLLLGQFLPEWAVFRWSVIWPVLLIVAGMFVISKKSSK